MSILDFLKRKKDIEKAKDPSRRAKLSTGQENQLKKKADGVLDENKPARASGEEMKEEKPMPTDRQAKVSKSKTLKAFSYEAVREPHVSEKASMLSESNQYTFKIDARANKQEVAKSVEGIYGVDVLSVNMIKIPAKKRRLGRHEGFRKGYSKAVVTIKEGQKIEIL